MLFLALSDAARGRPDTGRGQAYANASLFSAIEMEEILISLAAALVGALALIVVFNVFIAI
jgi:hypothetical protein